MSFLNLHPYEMFKADPNAGRLDRHYACAVRFAFLSLTAEDSSNILKNNTDNDANYDNY